MSAKAFLGILFLFTLVLGLFRMDLPYGASAKPKLQLSFWNGFTGPDGRAMLKIIRKFNEANPDVQVSMQRMAWDTYYNKLMVAAVDGRGPEVFVIHASALPRMHLAGFLQDVTPLYDRGDIPLTDYEPYVIDQTLFGKEHVGIPLDIHPQGLYCNVDMLRAAGLSHPPRSKAEFLQAMDAMRKPDGTWGYALTVWRNNFQTLLPQFGGRYLDANGNAALDDPHNVEALEFLGSLGKRIPPPENGLGWVGFRQKKVGMVWEGVYMIGDLQRLDDLHYIGAPIPQIGPKPGTLADSHVLCVRKGMDAARRDAAERFIKFLSDHSLEWAAAGQVPARRSIRFTPAFRAMQVQYAFSQQVPYVMYPPRTTILFELQTELDLAVEKVMRGRASAADALKVANDHLQNMLDRAKRERVQAGSK